MMTTICITSSDNKIWAIMCLGLMTLTLNGIKAKDLQTSEREAETSTKPSQRQRSRGDPYRENEVPRGNKLPHFDQCGLINQVQGTVIQILNTHYEYGKGIHMLHSITEGLQTDLSTLKAKIDEVEKLISASHDRNLTILGAYKSKTYPLPTLDPQTFRSSASLAKTIQTINWGLSNLTRLTQTQDEQYGELEKKYRGLRRKLKKVTTELAERRVVKKEEEEDHRYLLEHYMDKQTDINSKLLHRIQALEQRIKVQADEPYVKKTQGGCPAGFVRHFTSCYLFVNDTANWVDGEKHCQAQHSSAHLVSIETTDEAQYLVQYRIHNLEHWLSNYIWTGGNDMAEEGVWQWVGTDSLLAYTNWRPGQPDNHNDDQHCVYFRADGADPRWDDWHCYAARLNYVCEINMRA